MKYCSLQAKEGRKIKSRSLGLGGVVIRIEVLRGYQESHCLVHESKVMEVFSLDSRNLISGASNDPSQDPSSSPGAVRGGASRPQEQRWVGLGWC